MKSAWIFASAFGALSLSVFGQAGAVPAQYSFTISDFQIWTDTGVDLAAGDSLSIAAETKTGSDRNCNPRFLRSSRLQCGGSGVGSCETWASANPTVVGKSERKILILGDLPR